MKFMELENYLRDAPETNARVSERQHDDVMRAVRLAGQSGKSAASNWAKPAWGATLAATAMLVFYVTQGSRPVPPAPAGMSLASLGDRLRAIPIPVEAALPEKELELELERLKSDLKRFGLKS